MKLYSNLLMFILLNLIIPNLIAQTALVIGEHPSEVERNMVFELKADIQKVFPDELVDIVVVPDYSIYFHHIFVGSIVSNSLVKTFVESINSSVLERELEPETFVLMTTQNASKTSGKDLYIIGADDRGISYGVYEFSNKILGIDPLEFWTGKKPDAPDKFIIPDIVFREAPPTFPLRGYFDNDNDMLANWKGRKLIVELDVWKEIINSLARLRYNYIDPHDLLGRPEFWKWEYYKNMTDYKTDLNLVDQVIDYAHSKGMLVQIPMYLGWEFHHIDFDRICITEDYEHWMEVYEYYLEKTPLGKGDMFLARPRHPIYDYAYYCEAEEKAGIKTGPLMNRVFEGLSKLIQKYCPGAILVCDLWREGRPMWQSGDFAPDKDVMMLWADYYGGDFREWPEDKKEYDFGIYIHAGIWLNHVMQDPLVHQISEAVKEAVNRDMTNNIFVNGQDFKHFILNIEVCSRLAWDTEGFDPDEFYKEWTSRYFGKKVSSHVIRSLLLLNEAHTVLDGYKNITAASVAILNGMEEGKFESPFEIRRILRAKGLAKASLQTAINSIALVPEEAQMVYDDQIVFPAIIYYDNIKLLEAVTYFCEFLENGVKDSLAYKFYAENIRTALIKMRNTLDEGSKWGKWEGWTRVDHFRVYTPPPTLDQIDNIIQIYEEKMKF